MLRLSKKTEYALIALTNMSEYTSPDKLVTAKTLADQHQIPHEILGKVLQTLVHEGLLLSVQGMYGGYALARSAEDIRIKNIIEAVDGPISLISCRDKNNVPCGQYDNCNIKTPMELIQNELANFFESISLADLKCQASRNGGSHKLQYNVITE